MRKTILLSFLLLALVAWAVAQQGSNSQNPAGSAAQAPNAQPASGENIVEGCLGGSAGHYTVTDKTGTSYKLDLPPNADTSVLDQHLGQEIRVMGTMANGPSSAAASPGSGASTASPGGASMAQASITPSKMQKIGDTCKSSSGVPSSKK